MRLLQRVPSPPVLQIVQRAPFNRAHQQRPQIRLNRSLLRLRVLLALLTDLPAARRRYRLLQRLSQRAGTSEGSQGASHLPSLGCSLWLRAFRRADKLAADGICVFCHTPPLTVSPALLHP